MNEDDWIPISALQHYSYCPRQCALIHLEQVFDENLYTLRGRAVHQLVDTPDSVTTAGKRIERALPLYSSRLGLVGRADMKALVHVSILVPYQPSSAPSSARRLPMTSAAADWPTMRLKR
jgi:CRISPR-associated exonuclease Cas4